MHIMFLNYPILDFCYHCNLSVSFNIFLLSSLCISFSDFQAECPDLQGETWCFQERAKETSPSIWYVTTVWSKCSLLSSLLQF